MGKRIAFFFVVFAMMGVPLTAVAQAPEPNINDPLYRATGTQHRSYFFAEAGEHLVYRLYVPSTWTPTANMPLLVWINPTLDVDLPFVRGDNVLEKLAEERGYILAVPGGYERPRPFFNSPYRPVPARPRPAAETDNVPPDPPERALEKQRSEQDIVNVTEVVAAEYNVPRSRIYVFANSTAGAGVWHLAQEYPDLWAGAGVASAPIVLDGYPFERLQTVPFLVVHGDNDTTNSFEAAEQDVRILKENGLEAEFLPVPGGTHLEAWCLVLGDILDFFDRHEKATDR